MTKTLTTDQMTTLVKTVTIFVENRDPFTVDNVINELKRSGDMYDGFHDDKGSYIVDDIRDVIEAAVDTIMYNIFPEFSPVMKKVYTCEHYDLHSYDNDFDENYDEIEILHDEDFEVDKEGNRLPDREEVYNDTKDDEEEKRGPGWYKDPATGEWDWDRDAAESARYEEGDFDNYGDNNTEKDEEFHDSDHPTTYQLKIDKQCRINIKKKIFEEACWDENEEVVVIGNMNDETLFYIVRKADKEAEGFALNEGEYVFGEYQLKKGALRLSISSIIYEAEPGEVMNATIIWENSDLNYIKISY